MTTQTIDQNTTVVSALFDHVETLIKKGEKPAYTARLATDTNDFLNANNLQESKLRQLRSRYNIAQAKLNNGEISPELETEFKECVKMGKKIDDPHWHFTPANGLLNYYFFTKQHDKLVQAIEAFKGDNTYPIDNSSAQAKLTHYEAMVSALVHNDYTMAIQHYHNASNFYLEANDMQSYGIVLANIADLQAKQNVFISAKVSFETALSHLIGWTKNEFVTKKDYAATLIMLDEHEKAINVIYDTLDMYEQKGLKHEKGYNQLNMMKVICEELMDTPNMEKIQQLKDEVYYHVVLSV
jgi:tetratricopeptide (TPR) repeat protein